MNAKGQTDYEESKSASKVAQLEAEPEVFCTKPVFGSAYVRFARERQCWYVTVDLWADQNQQHHVDTLTGTYPSLGDSLVYVSNITRGRGLENVNIHVDAVGQPLQIPRAL